MYHPQKTTLYIFLDILFYIVFLFQQLNISSIHHIRWLEILHGMTELGFFSPPLLWY